MPLYIMSFILEYECNSNIIIKWFYYIPYLLNQTRLLIIFH